MGRRWFGFVLALLLAMPGPLRADQLTLEFAQEGDPAHPRALLLIHGSNQTRLNLGGLLREWGEKSWALRQHCSVYTYEYESSLILMPLPERVAADLLARLESDEFDATPNTRDTANPSRDVAVDDPRQPAPGFSQPRVELLVVGLGVGGTVAREFALKAASSQNLTVTRVAYVGALLDGLTVMDLRIALMKPDLAPIFGGLKLGSLDLSPGWLHLDDLTDPLQGWKERFKELSELYYLAAYGTRAEPPPRDPTENVIYGRGSVMPTALRAETDGLVHSSSAMGEATSPGAALTKAKLPLADAGHRDLQNRPEFFDFLFSEVVGKQTLYDYLLRRENIEAYYQFVLGAPSLGQYYWDERQDEAHSPGWRERFADSAGLYSWMWLAQEPIPESP